MDPEVNEFRTPGDVADLLKRPFHKEVIKSRTIGGRQVSYVPIDAVVDRLNKATLTWSWHIADIRIVTMPLKRRDGVVDTPVAQVIGTLSIPGLGERQGVGTSPCEGNEDAGKAAESDAIKRASSLFGVPIN